MKDEIKEILDNKLYFDLEEEDYIKIKDYITNLQEELKSANESITWYSNRFKAVERDNERLKETIENLTTMTVNGDRTQIKNTAQYKLDIYKSRNEKAIEYVERVCESEKNINPYILHAPTLLNILNGDDK